MTRLKQLLPYVVSSLIVACTWLFPAEASAFVRVNPAISVSCLNSGSVPFFEVANCTATLPQDATGTVDFSLVSGTRIARVAVDIAGKAQVQFRAYTPYTVGSYTLTASYLGDVQYNSATATTPFSITTANYTGNAGGTSGILSATCSNNNVAIYVNAFSCVATLPAGATGSVHFTISTTALTTAEIPTADVPIDSSGHATWSTITAGRQVPGNWQYVASYAGDSTYAAASTSWNVRVLQNLFVPILRCPNPITVGQTFSCSSLTPIGYGPIYTFYMDGSQWSQGGEDGVLGAVSSTYAGALTPGIHQVKLHSSGQAYLLPVDVTLNVRVVDKTTPVLSMTCSPSSVVYGGSVNCGVTLAGASGPVEFKSPNGDTWSTGTTQGRGSVIHYSNHSGNVPLAQSPYWFLLSPPKTDLVATVIRNGDKLVSDIKISGATGGLAIGVNRGGAYDSAFQYVKASAPNDNTWHHYEIDLSTYAGQQIRNFSITTDGNSYANSDKSWDAYFADIKITNTDGTEKRFYSGEPKIFAQPWTADSYNPGTVAAEADLPAASVTTAAPSGLNAGSYLLSATYAGNGFWNAATGSSTVTIEGAVSTTAVSCIPANPTFGQQVQCTATVSGSEGAGNVSFASSGTVLGSVPLSSGSASIFFTPSAAGSYNIAAVFSGSPNVLASSGNSTLVVAKANPNIQFSCNSPVAFTQGTTCTVVSPVSGVTGNVSLSIGGTSLASGSFASGMFTPPMVLTGYSEGTYVVQAQYAGTNNFLAATASFTVVVTPRLTPTLTLACTNSNSVPLFDTAHCTAVLPQDATGTVDFLLNGIRVTRVVVDIAGKAEGAFRVINPYGPGSYTVSATYRANAKYGSATTSIPFTVTAGSYSGNTGGVSGILSATCPIDNVVSYSSNFNCVATLPAGAHGQVHFSVSPVPGATPPASRDVDIDNTGKAVWNTGAFGGTFPGVWQYTASYAGDETNPAASVTWNVRVVKDKPSFTLKCSNPITVGQSFSCFSLTPQGYSGSFKFFMDDSVTPWSETPQGTGVAAISAPFQSPVPLAAGIHQVKLQFTGDSVLAPDYTVLNVKVVEKSNPAIAVACTPQSTTYGTPIACSASLSGATGSLAFKTPEGNTWTSSNAVGHGTMIHYANHSGGVPAINSAYQMLLSTPQNELNAAFIRGGDKLVADVKFAGATGYLSIGVGQGGGFDATNQFLKMAAPNDSTWHHYELDLASYAGQAFRNISVGTDSNSYANADRSWDGYFAEIKLVNADGTQRSYFSGQPVAYGEPWPSDLYNPGTLAAEADTPALATASPLNGLSIGVQSLSASYSGNSFWNMVTGSSAVTVGLGVSAVSVSCTPATPVFGQTATCTANVSGAGPGSSGFVDFTIVGGSSNFTNSRQVISGVATYLFQPLAAASYNITATYSGNPNYGGSTSTTGLTVAKAVPTLQVSCNTPVAVGAGTNCNVQTPAGATGNISLSIAGSQFGNGTPDAFGHLSLPSVLASYAVGTYSVQAHYDGDSNYLSADGSFSLTIAVPTSISVNCDPTSLTDASPNTSCTVQVSSGVTGNIALYIDGVQKGVQSVSAGGSASFPVSLVGYTSGAHTVTASYSGDSAHPSASATMSVPLVFTSGPPPNTPIYSFRIKNTSGDSGYQTNGNITDYFDSVTGPWQAEYDGMNRLIRHTALSGPTNDTRPYAVNQTSCWMHDPFGNITAQGITPYVGCPSIGSAVPSWMTSNVIDASNRLTGAYANGSSVSYSYDGGNMTTGIGDGGVVTSVLYDAENRICAVQGPPVGGLPMITGYLYDAEGRRVAKGTLASFSCSADFTVTSEYIIGPSGDEMTELNGSGQWIHTNVYAGAELSATYNDDGLGPHFQVNDWLGSKRVQVRSNGAKEGVWASLPFGNMQQGVACSTCGNTEASKHHLTGKERDVESGLDYFGARYYASTLGRFMSPDHPFIDQDPSYPQSWNLYSYVRNNPLKFFDPTGLDCVYLNDTGTAVENGDQGIDHNSSQGECAETGGYWAQGNVASSKDVRTFANSDLIAVNSKSLGQNTLNFANCAGCSTKNADGSLLGSWTVSFGNLRPSDLTPANQWTIGFSLGADPNAKYIPGLHTIRAYTPPSPRTGDPACWGAPDAVSEIHDIQNGIYGVAPKASTDGPFGSSIPQRTSKGDKYFGNANGDMAFNVFFTGMDYAVAVGNCLQGR